MASAAYGGSDAAIYVLDRFNVAERALSVSVDQDTAVPGQRQHEAARATPAPVAVGDRRAQVTAGLGVDQGCRGTGGHRRPSVR